MPNDGSPAPSPPRTEPLQAYQGHLRASLWRYRQRRFAGYDDLFDAPDTPDPARPPVFKTEFADRNVLLRPGAGDGEATRVLAAIPPGDRHQWFRSMASSQALAQSVFANLAACVRPGGRLNHSGHVVLLTDARNPAFAVGGEGDRAFRAIRRALLDPGLLRRCTWQALVLCLRQDGELNWLVEALAEKYGL